MSIVFSLFNRRRQRAEWRRAALSDLAAPPAEHPMLGLGGRSIELSLALNKPVSPDAVILAAEDLHSFVKRLRAQGEVGADDLRAGRRAADFLVNSAITLNLPDKVRRLLDNDAAELARSS